MRNALVAAVLCCTGLLLPHAVAQGLKRAPNYNLQLPGGKTLALSSYAGKVIFLAFVNTDCPHCRDACALLQKLQEDYGPRGFQALGVAFDERAKQDVGSFTRRSGAKFPIGYDNSFAILNFIERPPGIVHVPILVILDRAGIIRGYYFGDHEILTKEPEKNLRALAEKLLQEKPAKGPQFNF